MSTVTQSRPDVEVRIAADGYVILVAGRRTLTITVEEAAALAHELVMKRIAL